MNHEQMKKHQPQRDIIKEHERTVDALLKKSQKFEDGHDPDILNMIEDLQAEIVGMVGNMGSAVIMTMKASSMSNAAVEARAAGNAKRARELTAAADEELDKAGQISTLAIPLRKEVERLKGLYREAHDILSSCPTCGAIHAGGEVNHDR